MLAIQPDEEKRERLEKRKTNLPLRVSSHGESNPDLQNGILSASPSALAAISNSTGPAIPAWPPFSRRAYSRRLQPARATLPPVGAEAPQSVRTFEHDVRSWSIPGRRTRSVPRATTVAGAAARNRTEPHTAAPPWSYSGKQRRAAPPTHPPRASEMGPIRLGLAPNLAGVERGTRTPRTVKITSTSS